MTLTLLTDFGLEDIFVGVMKGVIRGIAPDAQVIDLTHAVPPQDVATAAFYLRMAWRYFPPGTVHVIVVDPGVGTGRRGVAVECRGHYFVAPDNGVLSQVLAGAAWRGVSLEKRDYQLASPSATFHGRDIFAPAGAHLAAGVELAELGPPIASLLPGALPAARREGDSWIGEIAWIDHFGNCVSTLPAELVAGAGDGLRIEVAGRYFPRLSRTYGEVGIGEAAALINSFGFLEIAVNHGSAAARLGIELGQAVRVDRG